MLLLSYIEEREEMYRSPPRLALVEPVGATLIRVGGHRTGYTTVKSDTVRQKRVNDLKQEDCQIWAITYLTNQT